MTWICFTSPVPITAARRWWAILTSKVPTSEIHPNISQYEAGLKKLFAQKKTGSIAIMRFDKETAAVLRPLPAFGLLFSHLCSFSPYSDDSELSYLLKYRRPFCPVTVSCDY
jgi:hypothetical protein